MICALVNPKLGNEICDPACGTGGFLLGAYQHILTHHTSPELRHIDENGLERGEVGDMLTDERQWQVLREKTFHGYDFDTTMVRIGLMNLMLHGIDQPNMRNGSNERNGSSPPLTFDKFTQRLRLRGLIWSIIHHSPACRFVNLGSRDGRG